MKVAICVLLSVIVAVSADNLGKCGGSCTSSVKCATDAGDDMSCRCVNLVCSHTEPCGGGCVTNAQCHNWSGDANCKCTWSFKCEVGGLAEITNKEAFLDLVEATKNKAKREQILQA